MSLFARASSSSLVGLGAPVRSRRPFSASTMSQARRNSAVWACLRLRSELISALPVDAYRRIQGLQVEVTKPPVLVTPGGAGWKMQGWSAAGQVALDGMGNNVGLVTVRDGLGLPAVIELQDMAKCSAIVRDGLIKTWRIDGSEYEPADVWHERQYDVAGSPLGLSPIAHAAYTLEKYDNAQTFAREWFDGQAIPAATLKNTAKLVPRRASDEIKDRFHAQVKHGGLFVHGNDWEYKPIAGAQSDANFLESMRADLVDVCRFLGCPSDVIDAAVSGSSITYASIGQRNLQLLVHNLSAPIKRREEAFSDLLPKPRFVKLNSDALLRMDPETRAKLVGQQVRDRTMAPSEARAIDNRMPFTDEQYGEFDRLFGRPKQSPDSAATGVSA